jgi:hypothetical protein
MAKPVLIVQVFSPLSFTMDESGGRFFKVVKKGEEDAAVLVVGGCCLLCAHFARNKNRTGNA